MNSKSIFNIFFVLMLLIFTNSATAETVTVHSGEYATDLTTFEYKLTNVVDDGWLKIYWSFNSTGDTIRFELGTSVLSEDFIDVLDTGVYLIPLDIYVNDVELDVNANATFYEYWEEVLWDRMILPIEDGQYNNFDVLEDQDPANWDVKGDEVSFFTSQTEWVYDYNTGVAKSWTSTVSYDFTLVYIEPPVTTSEEATVTSSDEEGNFIDDLPISTSVVYIALFSLISIRKLNLKILNKK